MCIYLFFIVQRVADFKIVDIMSDKWNYMFLSICLQARSAPFLIGIRGDWEMSLLFVYKFES